MVNWKDIHKDFAKIWYADETYQQTWEEAGLTYQDAQTWISAGFKPEDYWNVKEWKNHAFTSKQTQSWIKKGLTIYDAEFAAYLRGTNHQPHQALNLEQLREENKAAQEYLDVIFPQDQRSTIKKLDIKEKNLTGGLDLNDFVSLGRLGCFNNQLTSLNLTNCSKLSELVCSNNNLTDLILPTSDEQLTIYKIYISNNNLSGDCSLFSHLVNLERLIISNNNFTGSLKPLKNLTKLEQLIIDDTDIDSGLEYLPDSVEYFECSVKERKEAKCKFIEQELEPYGGTIKGWRQAWKRDQQIQLLQKQQSLFQNQEVKINYLELRVQELTSLIKTQKEKIINTFLRLFPEKDLLQELITIHLEYTRFKEQGANSSDYDEKCEEYEEKHQEIKSKLWKKLNKEEKNGIRNILKDCESLVKDELELEAKLKDKSLQIEEQIKLLQITDGNKEKETKIIAKHQEIQQKQTEQYQRERQKSLLIAKLQSTIETQGKEIERVNKTLNETIDKAISTPKLNIQGSINVEGGNAFIDNTIGDNVNLSHASVQSNQEQQAQIIQKETYGLPSSSKK